MSSFQLREYHGDVNGARYSLTLGRENHAEPLNLLNDAADALEMRQLRSSVRNRNYENEVFEEDDSLSAMRVALGSLRGGRSKSDVDSARVQVLLVALSRLFEIK